LLYISNTEVSVAICGSAVKIRRAFTTSGCIWSILWSSGKVGDEYFEIVLNGRKSTKRRYNYLSAKLQITLLAPKVLESFIMLRFPGEPHTHDLRSGMAKTWIIISDSSISLPFGSIAYSNEAIRSVIPIPE
jgi:hypothetical protein